MNSRTVIAEIRHPEELSLCKPVAGDHLKFNYGDFKRRADEKRRRVTLGPSSTPSRGHMNGHANGHGSTNGINGHRWEQRVHKMKTFFTEFLEDKIDG